MRISRRQLLGSLGGLGLFVALPALRARAGSDGYAGPFLITVHAGGGWDPTTHFDGKTANELVQVPYTEPATSGPFTYAPLSLKDGATELDTVQAFLTDYGSRLTVINGIDTQTNNHETGTKHVWSGKSFEQLPSLGAVFAAAKLGEQKLPVAYLSTGGYDVTANLVPLTRIASPTALRAVSLPNVSNPTAAPEDWSTFHDAETASRIRLANDERLIRLGQGAILPSETEGLQDLRVARAGMAGFDQLALALPTTPIETKTAFPALNPYNDTQLTSWLRSAETALYAFSSGQAAAANIATTGFDTHATHDTNHQKQTGKLFLLLRFIFELAETLGLTDKLYVVVGSDFGRTPTYNAGMGKDHWNVTSMLVSGPGIAGSRVIGATDEQLRPMRLDPASPSTTLATDDPAGTRLNPAHVHRAFRKVAGIEASTPATDFALPVEHPMDGLLG
jgi:hypothetical protein